VPVPSLPRRGLRGQCGVKGEGARRERKKQKSHASTRRRESRKAEVGRMQLLYCMLHQQ
jgi:hypothetical protein